MYLHDKISAECRTLFGISDGFEEYRLLNFSYLELLTDLIKKRILQKYSVSIR